MSWQMLGDMFCAAVLTWLVLEWISIGIVAAIIALRKVVRKRIVPLSKEEGDEIFSYRFRLDRDDTRLGDGLKGMNADVKEVVMGR